MLSRSSTMQGSWILQRCMTDFFIMNVFLNHCHSSNWSHKRHPVHSHSWGGWLQHAGQAHLRRFQQIEEADQSVGCGFPWSNLLPGCQQDYRSMSHSTNRSTSTSWTRWRWSLQVRVATIWGQKCQGVMLGCADRQCIRLHPGACAHDVLQQCHTSMDRQANEQSGESGIHMGTITDWEGHRKPHTW